VAGYSHANFTSAIVHSHVLNAISMGCTSSYSMFTSLTHKALILSGGRGLRPGRRRRQYSQVQPASCEPLSAASERIIITFSDNCLGSQHPALSPAGSRGRAGRHNLAADIAHHRHSTRNRTSYVVAVSYPRAAARASRFRYMRLGRNFAKCI